MEFCRIIEPYRSRRTTFTIYPLSDIHVGLIGLDEELLKRDVAKIRRNPNARWIGMGEICDLIVPGDRRWDERHVAPWVDTLDVAQSEIERTLDILKPIADKCWGMLNDTHTDRMRKDINRDVYSELLRRLGKDLPDELKGNRLQRFETECFLNVHFRRLKGDGKGSSSRSCPAGDVIHFYLHHGWFSGRLAGHVALNLERLPMKYDADIYCVAHGHKKHILPLTWITARYGGPHAAEKPIKLQRWAMMCGTYVDAHKESATGWPEKRGYYPTPLGCPVIKIKPSHRLIEVVDSGKMQ